MFFRVLMPNSKPKTSKKSTMNQAMNQLGIVKRHIVRADPAAVARLSQLGVATIHEAMGRVGLMKPYMRPVYSGARICGTAVTVLLQPGDNWMMHVAAEQLQPGDVAVAACTTDNEDGFFGDLLATSFALAVEVHAVWMPPAAQIHIRRRPGAEPPRKRFGRMVTACH